MAKLACLLKVQALGMFDLNRIMRSSDARQRRRLGALAAASVILAAATVLYLAQTACLLADAGAGEALPALAVAGGSLAGIVVTFLKANGQLFGYRDFDAVMALPVPTWQVVLSRVIPLYGMNLLFASLLMAPLLATFLVRSGADAASWAQGIAAIALAPLAPMALAVILAYGAASLAARMRRAKLAMGLIGLALATALVAAVMILSAGGPGPDADAALTAEGMRNLGDSLAAGAGALYPPALWAAAGIAAGDTARFACFAAVSAAPAALVTAAMARWYLPVNSLLAGGGQGRRAAKTIGGGRRSPFAAMVVKELRLLANTPIYLMNTAIGPLLAIGLGIACAVGGPSLLCAFTNLPAEVETALETASRAVLPWALFFCCAIAPTSASSLSLEGDARWIMQTAPVPARIIVGAKMAANALLCAPGALIGGGLTAYGMGARPIEAAALLCAPLAGTALSAALGAFLDARSPRYDWSSEYEVVKRSTAVLISVLCGMAVTVAGGFGAAAAGRHAAAATIGCTLLIGACAALIARKALRIDLRD